MPELSRYCRVYARSGACALINANSATMALSIFRLMLAADPSNTAHRPILSRKGMQFVSFSVTVAAGLADTGQRSAMILVDTDMHLVAAPPTPHAPTSKFGNHFQPSTPETQSEIFQGRSFPTLPPRLFQNGGNHLIMFDGFLNSAQYKQEFSQSTKIAWVSEKRRISEQPGTGGWKLSGLAACGYDGPTLTMCGLTA
jgi:hypothetical protein